MMHRCDPRTQQRPNLHIQGFERSAPVIALSMMNMLETLYQPVVAGGQSAPCPMCRRTWQAPGQSAEGVLRQDHFHHEKRQEGKGELMGYHHLGSIS
jgi:hypothetical protein